MIKILVFLSLALFCASEVRSPSCYECYGDVGSDCANGVNMPNITCSSDSANACYSHEVETTWNRWIARGCSMKTDPDLCQIIADNDTIILHWCKMCDVDFCNA